MADPRIRQIKIKTGIVKRLVKEEISYKKELSQQEEKVERLKAEAGCEYVIKKQEAEEDLGESEEYKEARSVLDSVKLEG
uniref:Tubulin-specific chaperone A n=1 Tax=Sander lucioperca TaxID=283035 RepID=A0A8C9YR25_SANLU